MSEEFKWTDEDAICIPKVNAVAVYINPRKEIVIRQEGDYGNEDQLVIIPSMHVSTLIHKLNEAMKELAEIDQE